MFSEAEKEALALGPPSTSISAERPTSTSVMVDQPRDAELWGGSLAWRSLRLSASFL